jgi:cellulose synthase/poly-beta-1,6-N-acetylglucosamine synthase-like glycosyltransferase
MSRLAASVVIPARDEAERLPRTLAAVQAAVAAVPGGAEVIVADHGSRDETAAIARRLGARVVDASAARTISGVRNRGARVAQGDVIAFVDADTLVEPDWLAAGVRLFREQPFCGAAGFPPATEQGNWLVRASGLFAAPDAHLLKSRAPARWLPSANLLVRRRTFDRLGGFDEELATCEDYDLTVRIRATGQELLRDPALRATHLREPQSVAQLFRKERWRGRASIQGAFRHGLVVSELPSLILPFAHVALALLVPLAAALFGVVGLLVALALLLAPSALMALRVANAAVTPWDVPSLFAFALVYNAARAAALVPERRSLTPAPAVPAQVNT